VTVMATGQSSDGVNSSDSRAAKEEEVTQTAGEVVILCI
jgi:hypothetical protein